MKITYTTYFLFFTFYIYAQQPLKQSIEIGISGAIENTSSNISLSLSHHINIGQKRNFQFYYGLRSNNIFNADVMYDKKQSSIQMIQNTTSYVSANNFYLGLNYPFAGRFSFGLNMDIIGLSLGSKQDSYYNSYRDSIVGIIYTNKVQTKPFEFNLFTFSNSLGSLNQEFYVEYLSENKWKFRTGFSHLVTELTASGGGLNEEKKVQNSITLFFVNISYPLWVKYK